MQATTKPPGNAFHRFLNAIASLKDGSFVALALLLFLLLSAPLLTSWPPPNSDEEMFGDVARTFAEHGWLASTLVAGQEQAMYWQPPLYFLLLAPVIRILGWSLAVLRGFSLFIGMIVVVLTYLLGKAFVSRPAARIGTVLLICNPFFVLYIKYGRMDGLCVLFILLSLLLAERAVRQGGARRFLLPGFAVAAAVLTHPLGCIAPVSILLWLATGARKRPMQFARSAAWLLLPALVGLGLWLIFILQDPHGFLLQMQYQLTRKDRGWSGFFLGFLSRYRFLPFVLAAGLLGLFGTWHVWRRSGRNTALLLLLIAALTSLVVIGVRFELPYHVYWTSFAGLAAGVAFAEMSPDRWKSPLRILVLAALVNGLAYFAYVIYSVRWKERATPGYDRISASVAAVLPDSCSVVSGGYPSLYWGLQQNRPDIRYVEKVYFDSSLARQVFRRLDYVIFARSFAPQEDAQEEARQLQSMDSLAGRVGKKLVLAGEFGEERRFVLSARVYKLIPPSDFVRTPP